VEKEHILAQTSKMAVLGEMAAGVVHELNQPLNIIRMASDSTRGLLERKEQKPEFEQLDEQLSVISGQVRRMADTIQSMRIFSRDDYGRKIAFDPSRAANQALS
jgi:C4-dicarboxylate-specific signal transduction histidine kinase